MFEVGQLVWILSSDESGKIMPNQSPVLVLQKYTGVPLAFPFNDKANGDFVGSERKTVYDILCEGIIECAIDEEWLKALTDKDIMLIMDAE